MNQTRDVEEKLQQLFHSSTREEKRPSISRRDTGVPRSSLITNEDTPPPVLKTIFSEKPWTHSEVGRNHKITKENKNLLRMNSNLRKSSEFHKRNMRNLSKCILLKPYLKECVKSHPNESSGHFSKDSFIYIHIYIYTHTLIMRARMPMWFGDILILLAWAFLFASWFCSQTWNSQMQEYLTVFQL